MLKTIPAWTELVGQGKAVRRPAGPQLRRRGSAAIAVAGLAVAGTALVAVPAYAGSHAPVPAAASWKLVKKVHGSGGPEFTAVTAVSSTSAWAFETRTGTSAKPLAWHLSGSAWSQVAFPGHSGEQVVAAGSSSAADVWAITSNFSRSRALRWNGSSWTAKGSFSKPIDDVVVFSFRNVWAFGGTFPASGGSWHYNGHRWRHITSGHGLFGGSALSSRSIWAFGGTVVAHWNGHTWSRTSVASLLPSGPLSTPGLTGIYARSAKNVWAVGTGGREDEGGPAVVLHYNGHHWSQAAVGASSNPAFTQVIPDGSHDLWIPVPSADGIPSKMLRYSGGHLRAVGMPIAGSKLSVLAVAAVPHRTRALGVGATYRKGEPGTDQSAVILEYS
jgi:hypothetical protein